jgi:hypothetical protein
MGLGDAIHDFFSSGKGLVRLAADRALATGVWSALPTPSADFRGGWFRTEGGAGVEDAHYLALKNAADAPVFDEIATRGEYPGDECDGAFCRLVGNTLAQRGGEQQFLGHSDQHL